MPTATKMNMKGTALTGRPVQGFFGEMQFRVEEGAIDMSRADSGMMPVLANHESSMQLGYVKSYSFEGKHRKKRNRSLEVDVELTETPLNKDYLGAIAQGHFQGMSPTVINLEPELIEAGESWFDSKYEIISGEVTEVTMTPIPANPEARVTEAMEASGGLRLDEAYLHATTLDTLTKKMQLAHSAAKEAEMPNDDGKTTLEAPAGTTVAEVGGTSELAKAITDGLASAVAQMQAPSNEGNVSAPPQESETPKSDAQLIAEKGKQIGQFELAAEYIEKGEPYSAFMEKAVTIAMGPGKHTRSLERQKSNLPPNAQPRLGNIMALEAEGHSSRAQEAFAMEVEYIKASPPDDSTLPMQSSRGIRLHDSFLGRVPDRATRAQLETFRYGNDGSTPIIDEGIMREQTQYLLTDDVPILQYTSNLEGVVGRPTIPIVESGGDLINVPEPGDPVAPTATNNQFPPHEGDITPPVLSEKQFSPKTLLATVRISRQSRIETGGFADAIVRRTLMDQYAERIRQDLLYGTGTGNNVRGINSTAGINTTFGSIANLAALKYLDPVEMRNPIVNAKIDLAPGSTAYIMAPKIYSKLLTTARSGGGDGFILENGVINGTGIPVLETVLDATPTLNQRAMFLGNWAYVWAAFWSGAEMVMDEITNQSVINFRFYRYWDVQVTRPLAIAKRTVTAD